MKVCEPQSTVSSTIDENAVSKIYKVIQVIGALYRYTVFMCNNILPLFTCFYEKWYSTIIMHLSTDSI